MEDIFEILGKKWNQFPEDIEAHFNELGITFRGKVVYINKKRVGIEEVIQYYLHEAGNIISGCRHLGALVGDWRPIDNLAKQCLEIYKVIKTDELKREARKHGLEPKGW